MLHKVRDLPSEARGIVENLIGRSMTEDETFSIRPMRLQKEGANPDTAREAAGRLEQYFSEIDSQHPPVSSDQANDALDEAMRHVRPGYTSIK